MGSSSVLVKPKTMKLVCVVSLLNTHHYGKRAKTGWLQIRKIVSEWGYMSVRELLFQTSDPSDFLLNRAVRAVTLDFSTIVFT